MMASTAQDSTQAAESRTLAMKTRIISHMNADHADSLTLYLQSYCGIPAHTAKSAKLSDISLEHMIVESGAGRNLVPFNPPMKSFAEARERMVAMHQESLKALGLSDVKITSFVLPRRLWQWALLFLCLWCYVTLPFPERVRPGSSSFMAYGWSIGNQVPLLAQLAADLGPVVLPGMLIIHAAEASYMWWSRLRKHGLTLNDVSTWLWLTHTFLSGFGGVKSFDDLVDEKRRGKEGKH